MDTEDTRSQLSEAVDSVLLKALTEGQIVVTDDGTPVTITPTAAMIRTAIARLQQLGISQAGGIRPGSKQAALIERIRTGGLKLTGELPPLSQEEDAA